MNSQRRYMLAASIGLCLLLSCVASALAGSEYGLPGEEFQGLRYPLERCWTVESNPAFLAKEERKVVGASFLPGFESSYRSSAYFFAPIRMESDNSNGVCGSIGVGVILRHITVGDLDGRGPNGEPLGSFSFSKSQLAASYGHKILPRFSIGVSVKVAYYSTSKIEGASLSSISKTAFGTDFGIRYEPTPTVDLAVSLANFPFQPDVTLDAEEEKWPISVRLDGGMTLLEKKLLLMAGVDYIKNDQRGGDDVYRPKGGANYRVHDYLMLGVGYANDGAMAGIRIIIEDLSVQYSIEDTDLGLLHYTAISYSFGSR